MPSREIENPIVNGPYDDPALHFRFDDEGITSEIALGRRISAYFLPVPQPKKKGKQLVFDTQWTTDRMEECEFVNRLKLSWGAWRDGRYDQATLACVPNGTFTSLFVTGCRVGRQLALQKVERQAVTWR